VTRKGLGYYAVAAICVAFIAYVFLAERSKETRHAEDALVFPHLLDRLNAVDELRIASKHGDLRLFREDGHWLVANFSDYRADFGMVRKTLLGLSQIRIVDVVTDKSSDYAKLHVSDVGEAGTETVVYRVASGEQALAELIVGRNRGAAAIGSLSEYYVRQPERSQAWLVEGVLPEFDSPLQWLDPRIIDLDNNRVRAITVNTFDGDRFRMARKSSRQNFRFENLPDGKSVRSQYRLNAVSQMLSQLDYADAIPTGR